METILSGEPSFPRGKGTLWIDGKWQESATNRLTDIVNPADRSVIAQVADADASDVDRAVKAAHAAWEDKRWAGLPPSERSRILFRLADLLEQAGPGIARLESRNTGKPCANLAMASDVPFSVDNLRFFAAAARDASGARAGEFAPGYTSMSRREPVGVVAQIAPWNYPLLMMAWKMGPALAAGCSIVFKPAPATPLSALVLAGLTREAGIPDGVFNLITGGNEAGEALVTHPLVSMMSLTGSTRTGSRLMECGAPRIARLHLELGGKAPILALPDCDARLLAAKVATAVTCNSGQDCTAGTRLLVPESRRNDLVDAVRTALGEVKTGDPLDDSVFMGPLISDAHRDRVTGFLDRARAQGARILLGGRIPPGLEGGAFLEPTLVDQVDQGDDIVQQEVFGPVLTVQTWRDMHEALAMANGTAYGLAASIFTSDVGRVMTMSRDLRFGTVWVNDHLPLASEMPHGGFKMSGFGKDLSAEAVSDYLVTKHVMVSHWSPS